MREVDPHFQGSPVADFDRYRPDERIRMAGERLRDEQAHPHGGSLHATRRFADEDGRGAAPFRGGEGGVLSAAARRAASRFGARFRPAKPCPQVVYDGFLDAPFARALLPQHPQRKPAGFTQGRDGRDGVAICTPRRRRSAPRWRGSTR